MISIPEGKGIEKAEAFGLKLNMQSYTFRKISLVEAFDRLKELGIRHIEVYPGHRIGGKWGDKVFDFNLSEEDQLEIKELAKQYEVEIVGYGVYTTSNIEDWHRLFLFAKTMGLEYITCEPEDAHLDLVENLAVETGIKVGIHNHPQPSAYWSPELLLAKIEHRSGLIGACADVGHWNREGLDQIEGLQKLEGRIQSIHFKDIDFKRRYSDGQEYQIDVVWGSGVLDVDAMILELKKQQYKGYITVEYEQDKDNLIQDLKDSLFYYDVVTEATF